MDIDQEWVKTNIDLIMKQFRIINPEFNTDRLSKEKKKILEDCDKPKYRPIYYIVKTMPDKIDRIKKENRELRADLKDYKQGLSVWKSNYDYSKKRLIDEWGIKSYEYEVVYGLCPK
jgi:hypothetical protein|tara:strand:+ start:104 stop:454 length:351 start_codon:yes stop_codon:yes gene_type:complete